MDRHAPAVQVTVREDRVWRRACQVSAAAVVLGTLAWSLAHGPAAGSSRVVLPLLAVALAAPLFRRGAATPHELRWDGAAWALDDHPCELAVSLDFGAWLLLAAGPRFGRRQWLALSRADHPAAWHGLRCALYCARPPPPTMTAGPGAVSTPDER